MKLKGSALLTYAHTDVWENGTDVHATIQTVIQTVGKMVQTYRLFMN